MSKLICWKWYHYLRAKAIIYLLKINDNMDLMVFLRSSRNSENIVSSLQKQYQNFLTKHPDGRISRGSFHDMMKVKGFLVWNIQVEYSFQNDQLNLLVTKECYPGTDTEKLERHIFRMYDTNEVRAFYV